MGCTGHIEGNLSVKIEVALLIRWERHDNEEKPE